MLDFSHCLYSDSFWFFVHALYLDCRFTKTCRGMHAYGCVLFLETISSGVAEECLALFFWHCCNAVQSEILSQFLHSMLYGHCLRAAGLSRISSPLAPMLVDRMSSSVRSVLSDRSMSRTFCWRRLPLALQDCVFISGSTQNGVV